MNTRLQAGRRVVHLREGSLVVGNRLEHHHRPKTSSQETLASLGALEHRRLHRRTRGRLPSAPRRRRTRLHRPTPGSARRTPCRSPGRPGSRRPWVAHLETCDLVEHPGLEVVVETLGDVDPLDTDAGTDLLGSWRRSRRALLPSRGRHHLNSPNRRRQRITAELQGDVLVRHRLRNAHPTGPEPVNDTTGRRSSATRSDAWSLGTLSTLTMPGRSVPAITSPSHSAERSLGGRLDHHGRADGDGRSHLVGHQIEGEVER